MKDINLFVWLTQLGISTAVPLAGFVLLGVWLHQSQGWGLWVIFVGVALGLFSAISGFINTLNTLHRMTEDGKKTAQPPVSFNEHD